MNMQIKTKLILDKYKIKANKSLGQNFLVDDNVLEEIVNVSDITKDDLVIEIGPGLGNLTEYLLEYAGKVMAIELDSNMIAILEERFSSYDNFEVINADILKINIDKLIEDNNKEFSSIKIVGNLPYYITTPIIFYILENFKKVDSITVMVQKEVADRIVSKGKCKEYGVLSIMSNIYCSAAKCFDVLPDSFIPSPNVNSSIILLDCTENRVKEIDNINEFKNIVKYSFSMRRKKLLNSLSSYINKDLIKEIIKYMEFSENIRAEEISIDEYIKISNYTFNIKDKLAN